MEPLVHQSGSPSVHELKRQHLTRAAAARPTADLLGALVDPFGHLDRGAFEVFAGRELPDGAVFPLVPRVLATTGESGELVNTYRHALEARELAVTGEEV